MIRGRLRQVRPKGPTLRFQYNPESVIQSGGIGGWEEIARPKRKTALEWRGLGSVRLNFTLFFDGFPDRSVATDIRTLRSFGHPRSAGKPPPELRFLYGPFSTETSWVVESLDFGEELRNDKLQIVRQEIAVTLVEYIDADVALSPAKRHRDKKRGDGKDRGKGGKQRVYVVRQGDTLAHIASALLGTEDEWQTLAQLNDIRDPRYLTAGARIRIPES